MKLALSLSFLFTGSLVLAQAPTAAVATRMANYTKAPSEETAADLIQALIEAAMEGKPLTPAPDAPASETGAGRQLALNLLANRQDGAPAGVGGGSSLLSLASVSDLLSGAIESGAFSKSTQGSVATFRANVVGGYRLFTGDCPRDAKQSYPLCISEDTGPLRGLSLALAFDSSRQDQVTPANPLDPAGSVQALLLRAQRGLAAVNLRYDFYRPRNQHSQGLLDAWKAGIDDLRTKAGDYAKALGEGPGILISEANREGKPKELHALLQDPKSKDDPLAVAQKFVADFLAAPGHQIAADTRRAYLDARKTFLAAEVTFYQNVLQRKLFTLEFTHQRPKDEPRYGSLRFIYDRQFGAYRDPQSGVDVPNWHVTLNAASDFFYDSSSVQKDRRLRDFQVAFQADRRLWRWKLLAQPTFTLAGYYQRLADDMVLEFNSDAIAPGLSIPLPKPANVILKGTKGDVGIAQAKLSIPLKDSGVSVPLAISWSNRTELLRTPGNDVRGHFGLLFDLDKLLSAVKH